MSFPNKTELIKYRLSKAEESYKDACLLAENKRWNLCINRLYYSCFYAVNALLLYADINAISHTGNKTQFSNHFIKNGILAVEYGKLFADLFNKRQKGDYSDFFDFDEATTQPYLTPVRHFINEITKMISNDSSQNVN